MNANLKILSFIFDIVVPLVIGYILKNKTNIDKKKIDKLIIVDIFVIYPILGMLSYWIISFNKTLIWLPIFGLINPILAGAIAFLSGKNKFEDPLEKGSYIVSYMLSNRGTIGGLVAFILLGQVGYAYANFALLFNTVTLYMIAYPVAGYYGNKDNNTKIPLRKIFFTKAQFPMVGLILGLILNASGIKRPDVFSDVFNIIIHLGAWFALVPIGMGIEFSEMKKYKKLIPEVTILKFIIMPLIMFVLASIFIKDEIMLKTIIIQSSVPAAINSVIVTRIKKLNINLTMMVFVSTTTIYLLLVFPILLLLF